MIRLDGLDGAIVGVGIRCGMDDVLVYDIQKVVDIIAERDGMDIEEAQEYVDFNIVDAYLGDGSPMYVGLLEDFGGIEHVLDMYETEGKDSGQACFAGPARSRRKLFLEIDAERKRQDAKWGEQNHPIRRDRDADVYRYLAELARGNCEMQTDLGSLTWHAILLEEFSEAFAEDTPEGQRAELVQVAAVAVSMIECIDRRKR